MTRPLLGVMAMALSVAGLGAWQARDGAARNAAATGGGTVTGVVVTDTGTPQPVRRATVRLSGAGATVRVVGTDDLGRFVFDRVPAGRVTISALKAGFVTAFHGSTEPGRGPGVPVAVTDGQTVDITIRLLPGAVITGAILTGQGFPAPNVTVAAVDTRPSNTVPIPLRAVTDDRGIYRIFGLAPGDYLVSALPQLVPQDARGLGPGGPVMRLTDADVQQARAGSAATANNTAGSSRPVGYAPVFYPGTTDAAGAATIHVTSGEERAGVDMALSVVPMSRLGGTLVDSDGVPVTSAQVLLIPKRGDQPSPVEALISSGALTMPRAAMSGATFSFTSVSPGQYTLVARTGSGQRGVAAAEAAAPVLWSVSDITIDGTDRTDLPLRLMPGLTMTGRYVVERGAAEAIDPSVLNLSLMAVNPLPGFASTYRAIPQPDGTFRISSVAPGRYVTRIDVPASMAAGRWMLKSAMADGRDLADRPLVAFAGATDLANVVVTLTTRPATVTGRLVDVSGRPVTRYSIVVATQDRALWLPNARRIRTARPATDGSFEITGLPAGDYAIAAVDNVENANVFDAGFLSELLGTSFRVTLAEGETRRQDFKVGG